MLLQSVNGHSQTRTLGTSCVQAHEIPDRNKCDPMSGILMLACSQLRVGAESIRCRIPSRTSRVSYQCQHPHFLSDVLDARLNLLSFKT